MITFSDIIKMFINLIIVVRHRIPCNAGTTAVSCFGATYHSVGLRHSIKKSILHLPFTEISAGWKMRLEFYSLMGILLPS